MFGEFGVGGQNIVGIRGVGGVSGESAVGEGGLDREDFFDEPENNLDKLLFIFNDR